jgi:hypothetical protein
MTLAIRPILVLLASVALAACFPESDRCDPDQHYRYGLCYAMDAAVSPVDGNDAGADFAHYGDVCAADRECATPTDFCAKYPSDPTGYCTRTGCLTDASLCPGGWSCLDLSMYGYPAICIKP